MRSKCRCIPALAPRRPSQTSQAENHFTAGRLFAWGAREQFLLFPRAAPAPAKQIMRKTTIQERVVAGLAAAKRRGRFGGRPPAIVGEKWEAILAALDGGMSKAAVCRNFDVKRTTLIDTLKRGGKHSQVLGAATGVVSSYSATSGD